MSDILLTQDLAFPTVSFAAPEWGIFLNGVPALPVRSVAAFDYKQDWTIADYQIEGGGFQSYDKVQLPFDARVRVTSGGTAAERQALLNAVIQVANSLDLYDIVTPEITYTSVNVSHYDLHRSANGGVGMIMIDIWLTEIRITATAAFTNTQQPSEAGQQSLGTVQPQPIGNTTIDAVR